jgi:hypothetical protein
MSQKGLKGSQDQRSFRCSLGLKHLIKDNISAGAFAKYCSRPGIGCRFLPHNSLQPVEHVISVGRTPKFTCGAGLLDLELLRTIMARPVRCNGWFGEILLTSLTRADEK